MRLIYIVAADVLRALGWEVEINEKENYWNLVLTNTTSSEDMPQSHKSCIRGLLRGWLMEFNYEGGRQQVNIYKDLHGLNPEDDRYSCLDTCVNRTESDIPVHKLDDREMFVRRKDRFDRYVLLAEPIDDPLTTRLTCGSKFNPDNKPEPDPWVKTISQEEYLREVSTLNGKIRQLEQQCADERQKTDLEKTKVERMLHNSVACLDAVKAMLESSGGATHRMRDFYAEAMVKFIGNAKATL